MKSIQTKISVLVGLLIIVISVGLSLISYEVASDVIIRQANESLMQMAHQSADKVSERIHSSWMLLETVAASEEFTEEDDWEEQKEIMLQTIDLEGYLTMMLAGTDGTAITTDDVTVDLSDVEYFQNAIAGKDTVSDPLLNEADGNMYVSYAVPIINDGKVIGALIAVKDGSELSSLISDINFAKTGYAYMVNSIGTIIAFKDYDMVKAGHNAIEDSKKDDSLKELADITKLMISGKNGAGKFNYSGGSRYVGYAPVDTTNWSLSVSAPKSEVLSGLNTLRNVCIMFSITFIILGLLAAFFIAKAIAIPLRLAADHLKLIATGDFTREVPAKFMKGKAEIATLCSAMHLMQDSMKEVIQNVIHESQQVTYKAIKLMKLQTQAFQKKVYINIQ